MGQFISKKKTKSSYEHNKVTKLLEIYINKSQRVNNSELRIINYLFTLIFIVAVDEIDDDNIKYRSLIGTSSNYMSLYDMQRFGKIPKCYFQMIDGNNCLFDDYLNILNGDFHYQNSENITSLRFYLINLFLKVHIETNGLTNIKYKSISKFSKTLENILGVVYNDITWSIFTNNIDPFFLSNPDEYEKLKDIITSLNDVSI